MGLDWRSVELIGTIIAAIASTIGVIIGSYQLLRDKPILKIVEPEGGFLRDLRPGLILTAKVINKGNRPAYNLRARLFIYDLKTNQRVPVQVLKIQYELECDTINEYVSRCTQKNPKVIGVEPKDSSKQSPIFMEITYPHAKGGNTPNELPPGASALVSYYPTGPLKGGIPSIVERESLPFTKGRYKIEIEVEADNSKPVKKVIKYEVIEDYSSFRMLT
ncbi:hypothetical protein [Thermococcus sp. GR4]|uniref:hypothetical protein n=1 Tax=Thermococcus sp. GR4 TaxID=1638254 RepID=UPI001431D8AE|nr:hypothetical protein [Thermococcus sp. GR4]NJE79429.1 hypothetical protein [Thermococcus sp. GR4]